MEKEEADCRSTLASHVSRNGASKFRAVVFCFRQTPMNLISSDEEARGSGALSFFSPRFSKNRGHTDTPLGGTESKHRDVLPKAAVVVIQVCGTEQESGCPVRVVSPGSFRFLCIYPYIS